VGCGPSGWGLDLLVAGSSDRIVTIGLASGASEGLDEYDEIIPPPPPNETQYAAFLGDEVWPYLATEVRPVEPDSAIWRLWVRSRDEWTISWNPDTLPFCYDLLLDGEDMWALDLLSYPTAIDGIELVLEVARREPRTLVLEPNGGEFWVIGEERHVVWESPSCLGGLVTISLSRDDGASWNTLYDSIENTGSIPWSVEGPASHECRIRVATPDGLVSDESDAVFTISEQGVDVADSLAQLDCLQLRQLAGNPTDRKVTLGLMVPVTGRIDVRVFGSDGRLVSTLVDGNLNRGWHVLHWDGRDDRTGRTDSGIYFIRARWRDREVCKRIVVVR
jgi:hypothetical protein